jgi:type III restriction enzyme
MPTCTACPSPSSPSDRATPNPKPSPLANEVYSVPGREDLEIVFPRLQGYRVELPEQWVFEDFDDEALLTVGQSELATWVQNAGIAGVEEEIDNEEYRKARPQRVAFELAAVLVQKFSSGTFGLDVPATDERDGELDDDITKANRPWLFPQLVRIAQRWIDECVTLDDGVSIGHLLPSQSLNAAAEKLYGQLLRSAAERDPVLLPTFEQHRPVGSTSNIHFATRKVTVRGHPQPAERRGARRDQGQLVGGVGGGHPRTPPRRAQLRQERPPRLRGPVRAPGQEPPLHPRLPRPHGARQDDGVDRTLIVEVSGGQKSPGPTMAKATTARDQWCVAVNNHGGWGIWAYLQVNDIAKASTEINAALDLLAEAQPNPKQLAAPSPPGPTPDSNTLEPAAL